MLPIPKEIRDEALDEVIDLERRYIAIDPGTLYNTYTDTRIYFICMVCDEDSGITRTLLEKLGYELEPSDKLGFYWIRLRTRFDIPKRKR